MQIQFAQVPGSIRTPGKYLELNNSLANRNLPTNRQTLLLCGQVLAGVVPPNGLNVAVPIFDTATADAYFGAGSMLARMVAAAIAANPYAPITCLPVADPAAGIKASASIAAASGTVPSLAGTVYFYIAGKAYQVAVTAGETVASFLQSLLTAINADGHCPLTAAYDNGTNTLILTAKNAGLEGNQIALSYDPGNTGLAITIPAMANGSGVPDLTQALANVYAVSYSMYVSGWTDSATLGAMKTQVTAAGSAIECRAQKVMAGYRGTISDSIALAKTLNSERCSIAGYWGSPSTPSDLAAAYAAVRASEEDPAVPLDTLPLAGIAPPPAASRYTRTELESLLYGGITPIIVGADGQTAQIVRAITTYTTNSQSIADPSWLDLTTIDTMDYVRDTIRADWVQAFGRAKLDGPTIAKVWSRTYMRLLQLQDAEILQNVEAHKSGLQVAPDATDPNRLDVAIPADIVPGLHVLAGVIYLIL